MFGSNPRRAPEPGDGTTLWVQSVFYTLQGEGPFLGQPAVFVRLAGCNLACTWCDTEFESSDWRPSLDELLDRIEAVRGRRCDLVVITGGEPLRQNIGPLVSRLLEAGSRVQLETNGTCWVPLPDDPRLSIVVSPKTAGLHPELMRRATAYKYVLAAGESDPADGLPTASTQARGEAVRIARPPAEATVFVMPRDDQEAAANARHRAACVDIAMAFGYNLTLQTHKLLEIE